MLYDISQPVIGCEVYPGDPAPEITLLNSIQKGDAYNLSAFSMCAHNGTHVDAPLHFLKDGKGVDQLDLRKMVGPAFVIEHSGEITAGDAERMVQKAKDLQEEAFKRILVKGDAVVSLGAAMAFVRAGVELIGSESQSVGPVESPGAVHRELLSAEVILLEGIRLTLVPEGVYRLLCVPLNLGHADGAPCRAVLTEINE